MALHLNQTNKIRTRMKKLIIGLFSLALFVGVQAQESEVLSAYEYLKVYDYEKANGNIAVAVENLMRAKESIDAAAVNEKTMLKSKTWKRRADVYVKLFREPAEKGEKSAYLNAAYESIIKALTVEINPKNNEPKIAEEQELRGRASFVGDTITGLGGVSYESGNYQVAADYFEKTYNLYKYFGRVDTSLYANIFFATYLGGNYDKALVIGDDLIKMNYNKQPNIYGLVAQIYQKKGEGAKGLQLIKDARAKFPLKTEFITEELNYYLTTNDNVNSLRVMNEAIEVFKNEPQMLKALYFNSGVMYGQSNQKELSRDYYKKALAIDAGYFSALNNLASSYLDEANVYIKEANALKLGDKRYDELKAKFNALYMEAGALLENAYASNEKAIADEKNAEKKAVLANEQVKLKDALFKIFFTLNDEAKIQKYETK